ncbi:MAG: tetratricopeptide repeat protein [Pyrinomonadaceae bacterium]
MVLIKDLLKKISDPRLTRSESALTRCALARELEASGSYEAACGALGDFWQGIGKRPRIIALEPAAQAAVLLRSGTLACCFDGAQRRPSAQQSAGQDLIREALDCYVEMGEKVRAVEARIEMAWWCCWRSEGAPDQARHMLIDATRDLSGEQEPELCVLALVRRAIIEKQAGRFAAALELLGEAASLCDGLAESYALKGIYHHTLALVLCGLGEIERRENYIDRALIEFAAAGSYFKLADYTRDHASSEHNLGQLHLKAGKLSQAREHLDRARRLYQSVKDRACVAVVHETRARLFLAEGRNFKAERLARVAVIALARDNSERAQVVKALTTHAVSLARLDRHDQAKEVLARAIATGERIGDSAGGPRRADACRRANPLFERRRTARGLRRRGLDAAARPTAASRDH